MHDESGRQISVRQLHVKIKSLPFGSLFLSTMALPSSSSITSTRLSFVSALAAHFESSSPSRKASPGAGHKPVEQPNKRRPLSELHKEASATTSNI